MLNQDDKTVARYIEPEALTFGDGTCSSNIESYLLNIRQNRTHIKFRLEQELHEVESPLIGAFNVSNLSIALGVLTRQLHLTDYSPCSEARGCARENGNRGEVSLW